VNNGGLLLTKLIIRGGVKMTENTSDYVQLVEEVYFSDGTVQKVGFCEGKWLVKSEYEKVAVSKKRILASP
jgi:hypothetical protein